MKYFNEEEQEIDETEEEELLDIKKIDSFLIVINNKSVLSN